MSSDPGDPTTLTFQAAMLAMVEKHGSFTGIIAAHESATDPDDKLLLEVAGLYMSYVKLEGKVADAERRLLRQKALSRWIEIMQR